MNSKVDFFLKEKSCCLVTKSCPIARQAPPSMDFLGKNTGMGC